MYQIHGETKWGRRDDLGLLSESEYKEFINDPICGYSFIEVVKDNGQHSKLMLTGEGYEVVYRGVYDATERATFLDYIEEKRKKTPKDPKLAQHDKADKGGAKDPHYLKAARGTDRKDQNYIPLYKRIEHRGNMPTAEAVLKNAKQASSGIWKLSKRQVMEIGGKYKFNIPNAKEKTKHLGSTGILMWRKDSKNYYLVKFSKHRMKRNRIQHELF